MTTYKIIYRFQFNDSDVQEFTLQDPATPAGTSQDTPANHLPAWTALEFHQCSHCPLQPDHGVQCPLGVALASVVDKCSRYTSHEPVEAQVITAERTVSSKTTAQRAFGSFIGLLTAISGCPHTTFFKPMARFHLPFSTDDETVYRATSMYLLAQYFRMQQHAEPDFELAGLKRIYENLQIVNQAVAQRLRAAVSGDGMVNALVLLDLYAKSLPFAITDRLQDVRDLFQPYLEPVNASEPLEHYPSI
jgi:hypothetical protein